MIVVKYLYLGCEDNRDLGVMMEETWGKFGREICMCLIININNKSYLLWQDTLITCFAANILFILTIFL